jgi:maltose O-acetyltransferase
LKKISIIKKIIARLKGFYSTNSYTTEELIKSHGGLVGDSVFIGREVIIDYDFCFLLEIGNGAVLSDRTIIELHDSSLPNVLGEGKAKIGKVKIGSRAYIGVNTVILPGVHIGSGAIVGACSLVNQDIPTGQVWGGVPARYICTVDDLKQKRMNSNSASLAYFDYIGEPEKKKIDYLPFKRNFVKEVKLFFNKD